MNRAFSVRVKQTIAIVSFSSPVRALSWAVLNAGFCYADHIINHRVRGSDASSCDQPRSWLRRAATELGLHGKVVAMATAVEMETPSQASLRAPAMASSRPCFIFSSARFPLAMAYKAISTLDPMIGYRNEGYLYFGKFAAWLDDAPNFIPARLTAFFMIIAAWAARLNPARALRTAGRDHAKHLSPNAGYPEAALAGAFGVQLGGPSIYFGKESTSRISASMHWSSVFSLAQEILIRACNTFTQLGGDYFRVAVRRRKDTSAARGAARMDASEIK